MTKLILASAISVLMLGGAAMAQTSSSGGSAGGGSAGGGTSGGAAGGGATDGNAAKPGVNGTQDGNGSSSETTGDIDGAGFLNRMGNNRSLFFNDKDEMLGDDDISKNYSGLTDAQRDDLRTQCGSLDAGQSDSQSVSDFCTRLKTMQ